MFCNLNCVVTLLGHRNIPIHLYYIVFALRHVIIFDIFVVLIVVIYLLLIKIECFHTIYTKFLA